MNRDRPRSRCRTPETGPIEEALTSVALGMLGSRTEHRDEVDPAEALMREVGAQLRQVRLERGEDLEQVAQYLRIRANYLVGIEEGDMSVMPGQTYALGFLRSYADHLGFDGDDLVSQIRSTVADLTGRTRLRLRTPLPESRLPKAPILVLSLAAIAGIYVGWSYLDRSGRVAIETVAEVPDELRSLAGEALPGDGLGARGDDAVNPEDGAVNPKVGAVDPEDASSPGSTSPPMDEPSAATPNTSPTDVPTAATSAASPSGATAEEPRPEDTVPPASAQPVDAARGAARAPGPGAAAEPSPGPMPAATPPAAPDASAATTEVVIEPGPAGTTAVESPEAEAPGTGAAEAVASDGSTPEEASESEMAPLEPGAGLGAASAGAGPGAASAGAPLVASAAPDQAVDDAPVIRERAGAEPPIPALAPAEEAARPSADEIIALLTARSTEGAAEAPRIYEAANADARVILHAIDHSWVQITSADGEYLRARILEPGDVFLVPNRDDLRLWTGNAGGLQVIVDGVPLAPLGPEGAVERRISLDPERLKERN